MGNLTPCYTKGQQTHYESWTDSQPGAQVLFHPSDTHRPCKAIKEKRTMPSKPFSSGTQLNSNRISFGWSADAGAQYLTHCCCWVTAVQIYCLLVDYPIRELKEPISACWITIISWKKNELTSIALHKWKDWMYGESKIKYGWLWFFGSCCWEGLPVFQVHNHILVGSSRS